MALGIANKVERLVVVSSGGVSRPDSAVYKFLNLFGKIMYWKIKGEDEMRAMYKVLCMCVCVLGGGGGGGGGRGCCRRHLPPKG